MGINYPGKTISAMKNTNFFEFTPKTLAASFGKGN